MNPRNGRITLCFFMLLAGFVTSHAADWPMWRCDAGRTGSTDEELPAELHLQWTRQYPALEPMGSGVRDLSSGKWDTTVGFEMVYSPIVLDETMFVGSSHNDSLTAIDVKTGEEKWRFYTGGPVRLAPAGWKNKVYVTSDDGFLYCVNAADGKLLWEFRGAPMKRRIIGDERLISAWPARGGPVIAPSTGSGQATVYFAASIWPFMGISVHALDAETGKTVWVNDTVGSKWVYGSGGSGGKIAPQGPLVVVGNRLFTPNNRLGASCFNRETGEYLRDVSSRGTWRACGAGAYFIIEGGRHLSAGVNNLETGKGVAGLTRFPVLSNGLMYYAHRKGISAADPTKIEPGGKDPRRAKVPSMWTLRPKERPASYRGYDVKAKAGSRLLISNGNRVFAVDIPAEGGEPKEGLRVEVEGRVEEALAAAGRLFVVTLEGGIYCFGADEVTPKTHKTEHKDLPEAADEWTKTAGQILKATRIKDGYALVLGLGSGRLLEELIKQSDLMVIGIDPDAKKIDALRRKLDAAGLYGNRGHSILGDPLDCGLPPYLASLIVSEDPETAGIAKGADFAGKIFHSLRPYGGVICLTAAKVSESVLKGWVESAKLEKAEVKQAGAFTLLTRVGPLPGSAPWTHHNADAGNTVSSRDELVRGPLGVLWFGGPSGTLTIDRHNGAPRPLVAGGRIVVFGLKGLTAVDVYTGRLLWQVDAPEIRKATLPYRPKPGEKVIGADRMGSPFVSVPDGIYFAGGGTCLRLDPATGKTVSKIKLPTDGKMKEFGPIRVHEDVLVAGVDLIRASESLFSRDRAHAGACRHIIAFDRTSGKVLWSRTADQGFGNGAVALGAGKVFCIDRWSDKPRGKVEGGKLAALDIRTGKTVWQTNENIFGMWLAYSPEVDVVLQSTGVYSYKNVHKSRAIVYKAADGAVLWDKPKGGGRRGPSFPNGKVIVTRHGGYGLLTGEKLPNKGPMKGGFGGKGCNYWIGSAHILAGRAGSISYIDLDTNTGYQLGGVRSGCLNPLVPADGVLNAPYSSTGCGCALNVRASVSFIHMPELAGKKKGGEDAKIDVR